MKTSMKQIQLYVRTQVRAGQPLLVGKSYGTPKSVNDTWQARKCLDEKGIVPIYKPCAGLDCGNYEKIPALINYAGIKQIAGLAAIKQKLGCA